MKILLLAHLTINSPEVTTAGWIQALLGAIRQYTDWQVGLVCLTDKESSVQKNGNITIYKVNTGRSSNPLYRAYRNITGKVDNPKWSEEYLRIINEYDPEIVHIFGTESFIAGIIPSIKQKTIVHIQGILHAYLNAWFPPVQISKGQLFRYSFNFVDYLKGHVQTQKYSLFRKMTERETKAFKDITYCMGRTDWDKALVTGINPSIKYFHVEEVLRPEFYETEQWQFDENRKLRLISVLSPSIYKGFDLILKSAQILKSRNINFEWLVCGTSEGDNIVSFFDKKLKLNHQKLNIKYCGMVNATELIALTQDSSIFVHPAYIDNSPNSVCEAQMLGIPVIATDVGGISSLVNSNKTGILIPANDPHLLISKIMTLYQNKDLCEILSENERITALIRHNRSNIVKHLEDAYRNVLNN